MKNETKDDMILDIFIGGYGGPSKFYVIVKSDNRYLSKYSYSPYGRLPNPLNNDDFTVNERSKKEIYDFINGLKEQTKFWELSYNNENILDGTQWHINLNEQNTIYSGSNEFPSNWEDVVEYINKFFI